jgi:hypothetical protein
MVILFDIQNGINVWSFFLKHAGELCIISLLGEIQQIHITPPHTHTHTQYEPLHLCQLLFRLPGPKNSELITSTMTSQQGNTLSSGHAPK